MGGKRVRIGIVAPSSPFDRETADNVTALARALFPESPPELLFDPQCFERHNHFAGTDESRASAFVAMANDPDIDFLWFARGGYGACRIAKTVLAELDERAKKKCFLGYSDAGTLLAPLHGAGHRVAHGPMCQDILRNGGEEAVARSLRWMVSGDAASLEGGLDHDTPSAAFTMIVLSQLLGTDLEPDLSGHVLLLEEVSEHLYAIDRILHHITSNTRMRSLAGIRLGRCNDIPENDVDFGMTPEEIVQHWCTASGIRYLGRADIGHDADNKIVPFG